MPIDLDATVSFGADFAPMGLVDALASYDLTFVLGQMRTVLNSLSEFERLLHCWRDAYQQCPVSADAEDRLVRAVSDTLTVLIFSAAPRLATRATVELHRAGAAAAISVYGRIGDLVGYGEGVSLYDALKQLTVDTASGLAGGTEVHQ